MSRSAMIVALFGVLIAASLAAGVETPAGPAPLAVLTFLDHVERSETFDARARQFVQKAWAERPAEARPDAFIPEALAVLSPRFKLALDALRDERYEEAARRMHELADAADPYLSWHASAFELKALVYLERTEQGQVLAETLYKHVEELSKLTFLAGEITYLLGYCQLQNLHYDEARQTLSGFAERFPDAPERLRMTAEQMVREIVARRKDGLGDVSDLMRYAGRELGHGRWDEPVTEKQREAVELLDKLIEEAERQEQSAASSAQGSGGSRSSGPPQSTQIPSSPAQQSQVVAGPTRIGELRAAPVARPGQMWGKMRPAEREAALQPIRESFPGRYLELIEQYYRELSK